MQYPVENEAHTVTPAMERADRHDAMHGASAPVTSAAAAPPAIGGRWNVLPLQLPVNAIHAIAGPNNQVLLVAGSGNSRADFEAGSFRTVLWNTATNALREIPTPDDLFCAGHVLLPDGRALVIGGTTSYPTDGKSFTGSDSVYAFDFRLQRYVELGAMAVGRWYPGVTKLGDGTALVYSGLDHTGRITNLIERYHPSTGQMELRPGRMRWSMYAALFLATNGRLVYTGAHTGTAPDGGPAAWNWQANTRQAVQGLPDASRRAAAASCFVGSAHHQRVMVLGGGWPAVRSTGIVKINDAQPLFRAGPPLPAAKGYVGCVNLPDGTMFEANGGGGNSRSAASYEASMLNAAGTAWTPMNPLPVHRLYHSLLLLLDDGRVASISSNPRGMPFDYSIAVFSPPYLFKGRRPVITAAPASMTYGGSYAVSAAASGASIAKFVLITPPAVTHSTDPNQRPLELAYSGGRIQIPASRNLLPPGPYRLFAVDSLGRPSTARWGTVG